MKFTQGQTIPIYLKEEHIIFLLQGGQLNYAIDGVQIRIEQEDRKICITKEQYRDIKRHAHEPYVLESILREIDK